MPKSSCAIGHCRNNSRRQKIWLSEFCVEHRAKHEEAQCTCLPPFELKRFPKNNLSVLNGWIEAVKFSRGGSENFFPTDYHRVCSSHFVDGCEFPTLNLLMAAESPDIGGSKTACDTSINSESDCGGTEPEQTSSTMNKSQKNDVDDSLLDSSITTTSSKNIEHCVKNEVSSPSLGGIAQNPFAIDDILQAYNIESDELVDTYNEAQDQITTDLRVLFTQREKQRAASASVFVPKPSKVNTGQILNGHTKKQTDMSSEDSDYLPANCITTSFVYLENKNPKGEQRIEPPLNFRKGETQECTECSNRFNLKNGMFDHFREKDCDHFLRCTFCDSLMLNSCALSAHYRLHFLADPFVCFLCGIQFGNKSMLLDHIDAHGYRCHTEKYFCRYCNIKLRSQDEFVKHNQENHIKILQKALPRQAITNPPVTFLGKLSPVIGSNGSPSNTIVSSPLNGDSLALTASQRGLTCKLCLKSLSRRDKLKMHMVHCARRLSIDPETELLKAGFPEAIAKAACNMPPDNYKCSRCKAILSSRYLLEKHRAVRPECPTRDRLPPEEESTHDDEDDNDPQDSISPLVSGGGSPDAVISLPEVQKTSERPVAHALPQPSPKLETPPKPDFVRAPAVHVMTPEEKILRLTCRVCQRVLSRRDKLRKHLALCCPKADRCLYTELVTAGFPPRRPDGTPISPPSHSSPGSLVSPSSPNSIDKIDVTNVTSVANHNDARATTSPLVSFLPLPSATSNIKDNASSNSCMRPIAPAATQRQPTGSQAVPLLKPSARQPVKVPVAGPGISKPEPEELDRETAELLQEMFDQQAQAPKRNKLECEKCHDIFDYKLALAKHDCSAAAKPASSMIASPDHSVTSHNGHTNMVPDISISS